MAVALSSGKARLTLRPHCGGTVDDLLLEPPGGGGAIAVLAPQERPATPSTPCEPGLFRGRLLAPFSDRIPQGRYFFGGVTYQLPINDREAGDAIHGFLYRTPMRVSSRSDKEAVLEYRSGGDWPGYPFGLTVTARYELFPGRFALTLTAGNHGNGPLPVSLGWHPYFTLPGVPRVDLLRLRLPAERYVRVDEKLIPTGELPPVEGTPWDFTTPRTIGAGELDLGFPLTGEKIVLSTPGERSLGGTVRTLTIEVGGAFRYCQLFVPPERSSVAIEPLTAATDAFNKPELGLAVLEPGAELRGFCQVSLT